MPKRKIYFMAPLANVDSSILKLNLERSFKIKDISIRNYCEYISKLEGITPRAVSSDLMRNFPTLLDCDRQKIYFVENSLEIQVNKNPIIQEEKLSSECFKFHADFVQKYLQPTVQKMRLFKEGNIFIPFCFMYYLKNNIPHNLMGLVFSRSEHIFSEKYSIIDNKELSELNKFINKINLPFSKGYLQLAFDNFELSYHTQNQYLSFLSLMISLETLFHISGHGELRYRISRNIAVLLGRKEKYDSNKLFSDIRELYDKRSKIVHTGKKGIIKNEDLMILRNYIRESIKMIYEINKDKDELLNILNSTGFNENLN
jgi:hypothetical protein